MYTVSYCIWYNFFLSAVLFAVCMLLNMCVLSFFWRGDSCGRAQLKPVSDRLTSFGPVLDLFESSQLNPIS